VVLEMCVWFCLESSTSWCRQYGKGVMVACKRELELRWWFATVAVK